MSTERFQVGKAQVVAVSDCRGDLVIRQWQDLDVRASGELEVVELEDRLVFESASDLELRVPQGVTVRVERGRGDVVIRGLSGDTSVVEVSGDLVLSNAGSGKIGRVAGDLVAKNLSGSLSVEQVSGDIVARNIDGDLSLALAGGDVIAQFISGSLSLAKGMGDINARSVNGDLEIIDGGRDANFRNLGGRCTAENISGDIRLLGGLGPYNHSLISGGDFVLIWPLESPLLLEAEATEIKNRLPLLDLQQSDSAITGRLGDGKTRLVVRAGGKLVLKEALMVSKQWNFDGDNLFEFDFVADLASLGATITSEVQEQVARVTAELENNFGPEFIHQMATQFSQKAGMAADKAREAAERSSARASTPKQRPKKGPRQDKGSDSAAKSSASDEAQLKILKMVEKGTISPEEANMLLQALDGD